MLAEVFNFFLEKEFPVPRPLPPLLRKYTLPILVCICTDDSSPELDPEWVGRGLATACKYTHQCSSNKYLQVTNVYLVGTYSARPRKGALRGAGAGSSNSNSNSSNSGNNNNNNNNSNNSNSNSNGGGGSGGGDGGGGDGGGGDGGGGDGGGGDGGGSGAADGTKLVSAFDPADICQYANDRSPGPNAAARRGANATAKPALRTPWPRPRRPAARRRRRRPAARAAVMVPPMKRWEKETSRVPVMAPMPMVVPMALKRSQPRKARPSRSN
jgi:hypothetical protein